MFKNIVGLGESLDLNTGSIDDLDQSHKAQGRAEVHPALRKPLERSDHYLLRTSNSSIMP